jgi:hypothetical protein
MVLVGALALELTEHLSRSRPGPKPSAGEDGQTLGDVIGDAELEARLLDESSVLAERDEHVVADPAAGGDVGVGDDAGQGDAVGSRCSTA